MDYVPHSDADVKKILETIGVSSVDELFDSVPERIRFTGGLRLPEPMSEPEVRRYFESLAGRNRTDCVTFLGGGAYSRFVPAVVDALSSRGEFYTAYTPYQAEASQGTLQTIFEYQTAICMLTGMDVSNASHYDGATALAEAAIMAYHVHRKKRTRFVVSRAVHPEYRQVLRTYVEPLGSELVEIPFDSETGATDMDALAAAVDDGVACVAFQSPNFFGVVEDGRAFSAAAGTAGALLVACCDPVSLAVLEPPGSYGADIVVGDGLGLGNYPCYGGPGFGYFAALSKYVRQMPGRIAGRTVDADGEPGYVLTFQTREQHIRREKASSNICTNQALCAMRALIHLVALGRSGYVRIAELSAQKAHYAAEKLVSAGLSLRFSGPFFCEFALKVPDARAVQKRLLQENDILIGPALETWYDDLADCLLVAVTETNSREEVDALAAALSG